MTAAGRAPGSSRAASRTQRFRGDAGPGSAAHRLHLVKGLFALTAASSLGDPRCTSSAPGAPDGLWLCGPPLCLMTRRYLLFQSRHRISNPAKRLLVDTEFPLLLSARILVPIEKNAWTREADQECLQLEIHASNESTFSNQHQTAGSSCWILISGVQCARDMFFFGMLCMAKTVPEHFKF